MADQTQSEDAERYFISQGWDAITINGHDLKAVTEAIAHAKSNDNGKPKVVIAKTVIGKGIPEVAGTAAGHGEGGAKFAAEARKGLGLPEEPFFVCEDVRAYFAAHAGDWQSQHFTEWDCDLRCVESGQPDTRIRARSTGVKDEIPADLLSRIPEFACRHRLRHARLRWCCDPTPWRRKCRS